MNMQPESNKPTTLDEMIRALADGELDFRDQPEVLAKIAEDPKAAQRLAQEQRLKQACAKAMDGPEMKCPNELAGKLLALANSGGAKAPTPATTTSSQNTAYAGPPVLARIGRWAPAAVAAVLLVAAGVLFTQANPSASGINAQAVTFHTPEKIEQLTGRHFDCAERPDRLKNPNQFGGDDFEQLPGKLSDYFDTDANQLALNLDGIGYDYQLTGTCSMPGSGAVHIVYHKHEDPAKSISVWIVPVSEEHKALQSGRVYTEVSGDVLRPVIFWRDGGLLYYVVGDSIEDADKAVQQLRQAA
jgi:anti-sigma factor RsiW